MFLPTGLTFIVHLIVVGARKLADLFGVPISKNNFSFHPRLRLFLSAAIIVTVSLYVGYACIFFISKGLNDYRATWKVVDRSVETAQQALAKEPTVNK